MSVVNGLLSELGPGAQVMGRGVNVIHREFIDIGGKHLRKVGHDAYLGHFLEKSLGKNITVSVWQKMIVAIKMDDGHTVREDFSASMWGIILGLVLGVIYGIVGVVVSAFAFDTGTMEFYIGLFLSASLILVLPLFYGGTRLLARAAL
jgi:hypothetical protein